MQLQPAGIGGGRKMDKWLDNPWFLKGVALLLAMLLFSTAPKVDPNKPGNLNVPSDEDSELLAGIPVKSYYDSENFVVSGIPETVDVTIQGPRSIVQQAKALRNFEVYVDLTNEEMGEHQVEIQIREISERLKVTIDPVYATVSIQEKVTKEFDVEAEFNTAIVENGFLAGAPTVKPGKVQITGAKDMVDKITYVKATVNVDGKIRENVTRDAAVLVLDKEMNKLNVQVEPQRVEVTIPVKSSSKKVPIDIVQKGAPPEGIDIESISLDVEEATILAPPDVLEDVERVRVEIDVSNIEEDTEVTLPVIISNGVVGVAPETAKLSVKVKRQEAEAQEPEAQEAEAQEAEAQEAGRQEDTIVSDLPITVEGQDEDYEVTILDPGSGVTSLTVLGENDSLSSLEQTDFQLLIDVSGLVEGEHSVDIQVSGPEEVEWKLAKEKASVSITKRET
jgi:YbbR domain-containing protein